MASIVLLASTVILLAYTGICFYRLATTRILAHDAPYNVTLPRTLAFEGRYAVWYNRELQVWPVCITTGPTMLLPMAAAYRCFGDGPFLPNVVSLTLILGCLIAAWLTALPKRPLESPWQIFSLLVAWVVLVAVTAKAIDHKLFFVPMGDVLAGALLLLAATSIGRLFQGGRIAVWSALSGACIALAVNTKFIAIMPGAILGGIVLVSALARLLPRRSLATWLAAFLAVLLGFELFHLASLGSWAAYLENWRQFGVFFQKAGSGVDTTKPALPELIMYHLRAFDRELGWCGLALVLPLLLAIPCSYRIVRGKSSREDWIGTIIAIQVSVFFLWWFCYSSCDAIRHIIPALVLLPFGCHFLISAWLQRVSSRAGRAAIMAGWPAALALACVLSPRGVWSPPRLQVPDEARMADLREVAREIAAVQGHDRQARFWRATWWDHFDVQLFLPRGFSCLSIDAPPQGTRFGESEHDYLLVSDLTSMPKIPPLLEARGGMQFRPIFRNPTFQLFQCAPATIASRATPSASHVNRSSGPDDALAAVNDRFSPRSSSDTLSPRFTWWNHVGTREWIQYDFTEASSVKAVKVYWFDDSGRGACRVPQSWRLLYRRGDDWLPVEGASGFGTERDAFNCVSFAPVTTTALRLEAQLQTGCSGGLLEWEVE